MAFISQDDTVSEDQSMLVAPSFMTSANDEDPYSGNGVSTIEIYPSTRRNILDDINNVENTVLPAPNEKESLSVFLRVKPNTEKELEIIKENQKIGKEDSAEIEKIVSVESDYQLAMHAPKESQTYKNSMNGVGKMTHRYTFTHIFKPETSQQDIFVDVVKPKVKDFLGGQNQLVFTYGATSAGKTFTIQGTPNNAGIVPRAIDTLFNTVGDQQQASGVPLKPAGFSKVVRVTPSEMRQLKKEKEAVFRLGLDLQIQQGRRSPAEDFMSSQASVSSQSSQSSQSSVLSSLSTRDSLDLSRLDQLFPGLASRDRESATVDVHDSNITYTVWISFAEIYNENIYDLLQKVPVSKQKTEKVKRNPLKLSDDRNGSTFVKGLREIRVANSDEAYQALMIGRENLHFSATRLNQNSSRSHCIFTIKVVRVADPNEPHLARVSLLSFCDLAGSERISKTHNTGDRQKEAGNINTSLLVLGRCIKAIRQNQLIKDAKKHQVVPYRESKLTRLFKTFFTGLGKASLLVCISQAQYLFDESIHVLKFASIASKVTIEQVKMPAPKPVKKNVSRFSTMVAGGKSFMGPSQSRFDKSSFLGRGSIAWEAPRSSTARSTLLPGQNMSVVQFGNTISSNGSSGLMDLTEAEEGIDREETVLTQGDASVLDNTVVQTQYDSLLALVEDLKEKLIDEKKKNLKLEGDLREELCKEFNDMLVEVEGDWEQRLAVERERASELAEWRITEYSTAVRKEKKRKRDEDQEFGSEVELVRVQNMLEKKEKELEHVNGQMVDNESVVTALKATVKKSNEAQGKLQTENSKLQFELAEQKRIVNEKQKELEEQKRIVSEKQKELDNGKGGEDEGETMAALREDLEKKDSEITDLNSLLQEAGEEFFEKQEEKVQLEGIIKEKDEQITQQGILIQDLEDRLMESHVLLQEVNNQMDEKEAKIEELEEAMEAAPSKETVNELQYKISLIEEDVKTEKGRADEAEDCVKKQMEKISELMEVLEEAPNAEEVIQLKESLKVQTQRAVDAEEVVAEQNKKMEELIDSLEKSPSPKDMKNLEKHLEEKSSELESEKTKVVEITQRMRDKIVELGEVEENLEAEVKKTASALKMAEEAKAAAKEANRIAELEKSAAKEAERVAEVEKASAKEADEKTFKAQEEKSELQRQKSKLLEEIAKLKENKLSVSQEFEADIECEELKGQIENLSRLNKEITKASEALKVDNDKLRAELDEVTKSLDNIKQVQIKEKMEVSMNNMFDDSQGGESVDLDYRSEELKQAKAESEQLLATNASLEQALNKAKEATSILQTELDSLKKLNVEVNAKTAAERDEGFLKKDQEIEELKKQLSLDKSSWEVSMKDLKTELEETKKSSEDNLSKIQKQLTDNQEELKRNQSLLDDFKKKDGDNSKTADALEDKLKQLEAEKKAKQQEISLRIESESRVDSLEKEVATKDQYVKELEDIIVEKDYTITQLEEKQGESETDGANKYLELQTKCTKLEENAVIVNQLKDDLKNKELSNKELEEKYAELEEKLHKAEEERSAIETKLNEELETSKQSYKKVEDDNKNLQSKINQAEEDLKTAKELDKEWMEKNKQTREDLEKRVQALSKDSQKSAELFEKEEEVIKLQADIKKLETKHAQLDEDFKKVQQKVKAMTTELEESQDEVKILKKSSKESAKEAGLHHEIKTKNTELQKELDRLKPLVEARQREEAALDLLREELKSKSKEIEKLQEKVDFLKANTEAKDYEVTKAKDERDKLMAHYDGILKQKQQELTTEKQRSAEAGKLKEAMARATPSKRDREAEELKKLKEQLEQKEEKVDDLKTQLLDLQKLMDEKGVAHEKESKRLKLANKKVIEEYKLANKELQKRLPLIAITSHNENNAMDKSTLEADDSKTDDSLVEVTPNVVKKKTRGRGRGGGASRTYSSQASCEDSNTENDPDVSTDGYKLNRKPRVSRNTKNKKEVSFSEAPDVDKSKSRKTKLKSDSSILMEKNCLSPVLESASATALDSFTTPGPCSTKKKRKLYSLTPQHNEVFTPPEGDGNHDSPHSTVKKQLSVRRSMRRK